jgi:hypothetical protein
MHWRRLKVTRYVTMFKDKFYLDLELREMAKYMRETELRERTCEKVQTLNKQLMNTLPCKICRAIFSINLSIFLYVNQVQRCTDSLMN